MSVKKKNLIAAIVNTVIVIATAFCLVTFFTKGGNGNMKSFGFVMFRYFTVDSNVFCALSSLCLLPCEYAAALNGKTRLPKWAQIFKLMGTVTVTLTMLVVIAFLLPMTGDFSGMYGGVNFYLHLAGPIMAVYSFCFLENDNMLDKAKGVIPVAPILIYGIVYFVMVIVIGPERGGWPDFYMFNMGGRWYIAVGAIAAVSLLISMGEFALNQRRFKNVRKS